MFDRLVPNKSRPLSEWTDDELLYEYYRLREPQWIGGNEAIRSLNVWTHKVFRECNRRNLI